MTINLKVPDLNELKPRITVFGVGGAGGNAVNNMIVAGLEGVDFVIANTDAQALASAKAERTVQMGTHITEGLGAGSKPEIGAAAAEEALAEIKAQLAGAHMVFITAGMGGGTGTGAAPVIARAAKEEGILTVGVVTKPFQFEGQRRCETAVKGISELQKYVDTLIVIPNQNLFRVANEKTTFADAFAMADEVLHSGVACITDLMVKEGLINLDFADVKAVMSEMGKAMMGTGEASGDKRALEAAEAAIANPLLDDVSMKGAGGLLISITGGSDLTLYEVDEAASRIREEVAQEANIILGATFDDSLEGKVRVSVVATGIENKAGAQPRPVSTYESGDGVSLSHRLATLSAEPGSKPQPAQARQDEAAKPAAPWQPSGDVTIEQRPAPRPAASAQLTQSEPQQSDAAPKRFIPQPPAEMKRPARRMPRIEDLPQIAQTQLAARRGEAPEHGVDEHKKKAGFFERLAGRARAHDEPEADQPKLEPDFHQEPRVPSRNEGVDFPAPRVLDTAIAAPRPVAPAPATVHRPAPDQAAQQRPAAQRQPAPRGDMDDDLEIPAFLRRQAN